MKTFEDLNGQIVYNKAKSKTEALSMKDQAKELSQTGKSVAIFFGKLYHLYLAPGHDPYQVRRDIDSFLNPTPNISNEDNKTKGTQLRDSHGKFVGKKQTIPKPDSPTNTTVQKKKSFWDSLR